MPQDEAGRIAPEVAVRLGVAEAPVQVVVSVLSPT
jgi:hypothetical protein